MKNSTNCLALTVRKEYRITIVRNVSLKMIKISTKVLMSVIALNLLNMFV